MEPKVYHYVDPGESSSYESFFQMVDLKKIDQKVSKVQHGFGEMRNEAQKIVKEESVPQSFQIAKQLYGSDKYQVRMVGVFVLGYTASKSEDAFKILRKTVSEDPSWQVQEILAQAFSDYCKQIGYEKALPTIKEWFKDKNPNVRRAVSEGLRIWNQRDYFREHPEVAVKLLSGLKGDDSEYVRKSIGNALRDISRKEKDLVRKELANWDKSDPKIAFTYGLASKFL
jgi:3-methyladenine DNA glycosylase AlkC